MCFQAGSGNCARNERSQGTRIAEQAAGPHRAPLAEEHMPDIVPVSPVARRSFLSRLGAGVTVLGAAFIGRESVAEAQPARTGRWQPTRHAQDDWLDQLPGQHRFVFDTTEPNNLATSMLYANNFFIANASGYGLKDSDAAVVLVLRHSSTVFAYADAMWAKYGAVLGDRSNFDDPLTTKRPVINVFNSAAHGASLSTRGTTLDGLATRGVHFAVCQMATRFYAGSIATTIGGTAEDVYTELVSNLVPNAHMAPAGIVAVNRAQERGYAFQARREIVEKLVFL